MSEWRIQPARAVRGRWRPPGDKSMSHRAAILALLAEGTTVITHFLESDDCLRTLQIVQQLGASVEWRGESHLAISGVGRQPLREPNDVLDAGNSGTTARLMAGVLASAPLFSVLTGDESLRQRPMRRIVEPLQRMGAQIDGRKAPADYHLPSAEASCVPSSIKPQLPVRRSNRVFCWQACAPKGQRK
jgi:3-phosphoshikimate 1-carboxyvinyltransferase